MNAISLSRSSYSALNDFKSLDYPSSGRLKKIYFRNLNGLRFFAALLVILSHLEALKNIVGLSNYEHVRFFENSGYIGVVLFFVLSGFLITNLLLREQSAFKDISVNRFYIRRALRIWPLYFLILFLGNFIFPVVPFLNYTNSTQPSNKEFLLYLLLMPNISALFFAPLPFLAQLWSIGVEEQFYIMWPLILRKTKNILGFVVRLILVTWCVKLILTVIGIWYAPSFIKIAVNFLHITSFDSLFTGAAGAIFFESKKYQQIKKFIFDKRFQVTFYSILLALIATGFYFPYINTQVYSVLFLVLILNLALNKNCLISFENKVLNYLGKISYGLYIYHIISIIICIKTAKLFYVDNYLVILLGSLSITILLSSISFEFFEKWFLKFKERPLLNKQPKTSVNGIYLVGKKVSF